MLKFNIFICLIIILSVSTSRAQVKKSKENYTSNSINNQTIIENSPHKSASSNAQKASDTIITSLQKQALISYDFGKIKLNQPVYHNFILKNTASEAVFVKNVVVTCGCTNPEWSKTAVHPDSTTVVRVGFNAAVAGKFDKPFSIQLSNGVVQQLTIKGMVYAPPNGSVPPNRALQHLKNIDW